MSVLDKAKGHYRELGRKCIKVPEWGEPGSPFLVYASPMTVGQRDRVNDAGNTGTASMLVDVLLEKAEDKQGVKLFTPDDRHGLTHEVDSSVVSRIALSILAGPSDEDLEKN